MKEKRAMARITLMNQPVVQFLVIQAAIARAVVAEDLVIFKMIISVPKNFCQLRMADPANKTFEDFEKSTQGGGQSECPLGYGSSPQKEEQSECPLGFGSSNDSECPSGQLRRLLP